MQNVRRRQSIRWKLVSAFMAVAGVVGLFVGAAIAIHFETVERAAQLEAEHVAEIIADGAVEKNSFRPDLKEYVTRLYALHNRDVVIVDADEKVLADAEEPDEIGVVFEEDSAGDVGKTIRDNRPRVFIETSARHPEMIRQLVVPLRRGVSYRGNGAFGAVILEYTSIREELFSKESGKLYLIAAAGIVVVLLVTLFGLSIAKRIAQPLQALQNSVERIAAQDYEARIPITSSDEIGLVSVAFNKMAEDLSVSHAERLEHKRELEKRVLERTRELAQTNTLLQQEAHERQLAHERAEYLASYDSVTGLPNQSLFLERLEHKLLSAPDKHLKIAVVALELEPFETIIEAYGREVGDQLLKVIAEHVVQTGGGDATRFGRIGTDRFAVAAYGIDNVEQVGRYVQQRLDASFREPFRVGDIDLRVSVKAGIALFPDDAADADMLLRNAMAALKKAKESGERCLFFTQTMTERVAERLSLENQLRRALENEEFVLHYRPRVTLTSGKVTGAEALILWNDPRAGLMPPERFVPVLEETGLIVDVGRWMLRKAVDDQLRWCNAGLSTVRIAVIVSPPQLRHRGFVDEIRQAIDIDARAAQGLELEISESLIMEDVKHSIASLRAIRAMGVSVAIDDFGTGFSSLSHLSKLPVDTLKIDRSFMTDMTAAPEGLALVSTFIKLAHSLKLKVVAKGVETDEQSRLLRLLSCDQMQGSLIGNPTPREIFESRYLTPAPSDREIALGTSARVTT